MSRSSLYARTARLMRIAHDCSRLGVSTLEGLERAAAAESSLRLSRRALLTGSVRLAAGGAALQLGTGKACAARNAPAPRVAIVGAGLAGLACADQLQRAGILATLYEANPSRVGGRCYSLRGLFPGQVAENGGEFIDTLHKTMLGYAHEFKLDLEDVEHVPGEEVFYFRGRHYSSEQVVEEYRELVTRMRPDLQACSGSPTYFTHTPADVELDHTDLATYLSTRGAGLPLIQAVLAEAYVAEYGLEPHQQSCLNLLLFLHLDRRSHFQPFGVYSDERYHVIEGNDRIVAGLRNRFHGRIEQGRELERLAFNRSGEYELKFRGSSRVERADTVVVAVPFAVLRHVALDASLGLSAGKRRAIAELGYGMNAKTMIAFNGRPWLDQHGSNGTAYSDLPNVQNTWETNPARAGSRAILTDYAGGNRGATLDRTSLQNQVGAFLADLDRVYPGVSAAVTRTPSGYVAHREHWPSSPHSRGSYTCYTPGQFTGLAGLEAEAAGRLKFAGEHSDSFYSWQGFMEGACLSGHRAAAEILADIKNGVL